MKKDDEEDAQSSQSGKSTPRRRGKGHKRDAPGAEDGPAAPRRDHPGPPGTDPAALRGSGLRRKAAAEAASTLPPECGLVGSMARWWATSRRLSSPPRSARGVAAPPPGRPRRQRHHLAPSGRRPTGSTSCSRRPAIPLQTMPYPNAHEHILARNNVGCGAVQSGVCQRRCRTREQ